MSSNEDYLLELSKLIDVNKETLNEIIHASIKIKDNSYCVYSKFRVGSVVLTKNNNIYKGVNIENISYGATNCAERSAIFAAISLGEREFKLITVSSDLDTFLTPCGLCRQVMSEFNIKYILLINKNKSIKLIKLEALFPDEPVIDCLKNK